MRALCAFCAWSISSSRRGFQIRACRSCARPAAERALPLGLVLDLLGRAGAGLRSLALDGRWPVPPPVLRQLEQAGAQAALTDLSAHASVLAVAPGALRGLRRLTICVALELQLGVPGDADADSGDDADASDEEDDGAADAEYQEFLGGLRVRALELVRTALARCEAVGSLRVLAVTVVDVDLAEEAAFQDDCRRLFDAFRERRPDVALRPAFKTAFE